MCTLYCYIHISSKNNTLSKWLFYFHSRVHGLRMKVPESQPWREFLCATRLGKQHKRTSGSEKTPPIQPANNTIFKTMSIHHIASIWLDTAWIKWMTVCRFTWLKRYSMWLSFSSNRGKLLISPTSILMWKCSDWIRKGQTKTSKQNLLLWFNMEGFFILVMHSHDV